MKELKVYVPQDGPYGLVPEEGGEPVEEETCYLKSDVDAVIAGLKQKLENHRKWIAKHPGYYTKDQKQKRKEKRENGKGI